MLKTGICRFGQYWSNALHIWIPGCAIFESCLYSFGGPHHRRIAPYISTKLHQYCPILSTYYSPTHIHNSQYVKIVSMVFRLILLLAIVLLTACTVVSPCVEIATDKSGGVGVAITSSMVVTVEHVLKDANWIVVKGHSRWMPAKEVTRIESSIEDLVVLSVKGVVLPPPANIRRIKDGDSGSPLLVNGDVIGLCYGNVVRTGTILVLPFKDVEELLKRLGMR